MSSRGNSAPNPQDVGHLLITMILEPRAGDWSLRRWSGLATLTSELARFLAAHQFSATWAVGDPAHSAATATVLAAHEGHELALLGDPSWLGPTAGRTRFARELARRIHSARHEGLDLTTLVPRDARIDEHLDLVIKHGITAVAGVAPPTGWSPAAPRALRFGVWEMPITTSLPRRGGWFDGIGRVAKRIRRAASASASIHLLVDVPAVIEVGPSAKRQVFRLMGRVAQQRDRGRLEVNSLAQAAERLSTVPAATPQRSILRAAG